MKQRMYSIVLTQAIVEKLDELCVGEQMTRSGMINKILGDYLKVNTTGMLADEVLKAAGGLLAEFDEVVAISPYGLLVGSVLAYPYRPMARYQLEVYRNWDHSFGQCTVYFRTRNPQLMGLLKRFFVAWMAVDYAFSKADMTYDATLGRFVRVFPLSQQWMTDYLGQQVGYYLRGLDFIMKRWLSKGYLDNQELSSLYQLLIIERRTNL